MSKTLQCNCFVYYGVIVGEGEIQTLMKRSKQKDKYSFIFGQDLQFQSVGLTESSGRYVIGKELYYEYQFSILQLKYDVENNLKLYNANGRAINIKLDRQEELAITKKLYSMGFFNMIDYHLFCNYQYVEK